MKRAFGIILVVGFNLLLLFIILEAGYRFWLHYSKESFRDFEANVATVESGATKRSLSGKITMGDLIRKSDHPGRVYEFIPNIKATFLGRQFETNSWGMRDVEYSIEKKQGVKRIAGLGDSVMFGWGVQLEESYAKIAEQDLRSQGLDTEFLNFAVPGYNTAMEVDTHYHLARRFDPDIVVIHFVDNDLTIPLFMELPNDLFALDKSYVAEAVSEFNRALRKRKRESKKLVGVEFTGVEPTQKEKVLEQYRYMIGEEGFRSAFAKLANMACEDKTEVIILAGKLRGQFKNLVVREVKKHRFHLVEAYPTVNRYIAENNLDDSAEGRKKLLWLNDSDPHPNLLGHQLYAKALMPKIKELLLAKDESHLPNCGG